MRFYIRRPIKSWRTSAALYGGYKRLLWVILCCYLGRHNWLHTYVVKERRTVMACDLCRKRKGGEA